MKKFYSIYLFILFSLFNCEKIVDVNLPTIEPKLIIDASFEVYFNENPITTNTVVKLRLSADYFSETLPAVTNASVYLTDLTNNITIPFSDDNLDGNYLPTNTFIPTDNVEYELTVVYNNETYIATATKIKSSVLDTVFQGDKTLFTGKEIELKVAFNDPIDKENYYLFDFTNSLFLPIEDRFFNGTNYNFSFFYQEDEIELPTNVTVKMSGISKDYFTYFRILLDQSGINGGGPFQSVPSALLGNIINTSNPNNYPLGYFHISETDAFNLDLVEKN